jgi:hypothetical protein
MTPAKTARARILAVTAIVALAIRKNIQSYFIEPKISQSYKTANSFPSYGPPSGLTGPCPWLPGNYLGENKNVVIEEEIIEEDSDKEMSRDEDECECENTENLIETEKEGLMVEEKKPQKKKKSGPTLSQLIPLN